MGGHETKFSGGAGPGGDLFMGKLYVILDLRNVYVPLSSMSG